jgi:ABC-type spermidine/putrescine transport system permease subunit I
MTVATATASAAAPRASRDLTLLLLLPAVVILIALFLVPLVLFFIRTFAEFDGSTADFVEQARDLLFSQAFLTALTTTNWIALIVTATVLLVGYPIAYYHDRDRRRRPWHCRLSIGAVFHQHHRAHSLVDGLLWRAGGLVNDSLLAGS